jgi:hypothetical protein
MMRFNARRSSIKASAFRSGNSNGCWRGNRNGGQCHSPNALGLLGRFGSEYIRTVVGFPTKGSVTVKACFGWTFFRLNTPATRCVYHFSDLNIVSYPQDLRSSWSNVCNDGAPAMRAS